MTDNQAVQLEPILAELRQHATPELDNRLRDVTAIKLRERANSARAILLDTEGYVRGAGCWLAVPAATDDIPAISRAEVRIIDALLAAAPPSHGCISIVQLARNNAKEQFYKYGWDAPAPTETSEPVTHSNITAMVLAGDAVTFAEFTIYRAVETLLSTVFGALYDFELADRFDAIMADKGDVTPLDMLGDTTAHEVMFQTVLDNATAVVIAYMTTVVPDTTTEDTPPVQYLSAFPVTLLDGSIVPFGDIVTRNHDGVEGAPNLRQHTKPALVLSIIAQHAHTTHFTQLHGGEIPKADLGTEHDIASFNTGIHPDFVFSAELQAGLVKLDDYITATGGSFMSPIAKITERQMVFMLDSDTFNRIQLTSFSAHGVYYVMGSDASTNYRTQLSGVSEYVGTEAIRGEETITHGFAAYTTMLKHRLTQISADATPLDTICANIAACQAAGEYDLAQKLNDYIEQRTAE